MSRAFARDASRGFTLLELLIGAMISAILLAALYSVFQSLLKAQSGMYELITKTVPRTQVVDIIQNDIENMVAPNGTLSGNLDGQSQTDSGNASDTLQLYTTTGRVDAAWPWGEIQCVAYSLVQPDAQSSDYGGQLVRTVTRNLLPGGLVTTDTQNQDSTALLDHVASLEFDYYDGQSWTETWDSTQAQGVLPAGSLPKAIRARIDFEPDPKTGQTAPPIEITCEVVAQKPGTASSTAATSGTGAT